MQKLKKEINSNKKLVLGIIFGIILGTSVTGVVAYSVYASNVVYDNTNSQLTSTDVNGAIDELYTRINQLNTYKDLQCPGCVYRKSTTKKYNSNASGANGTNNKLSSSEYTTDYTTLNSNYFLGHVIDSNGYILSSYVCGIENGTFFCLRGVDSDQSLQDYKPFYQENANRMKKIFSGCNPTASYAFCSGGVGANAYPIGRVTVYEGDGNCDVSYAGYSLCT